MNSAKSIRIISSFKLGYINSIIENELVESFSSEINPNNFNPISSLLETFLSFKEDYQAVFEEELPIFQEYRNDRDIYEYLSALFLIVKSKVTEMDNSEMELAYFTGASLALAYDGNSGTIESNKFSIIFKYLLTITNRLNFSCEIEDKIELLLGDNLYDCMTARNSLLEEFVGHHLTSEHKKAFRYYDKIIVRRY